MSKVREAGPTCSVMALDRPYALIPIGHTPLEVVITHPKGNWDEQEVHLALRRNDGSEVEVPLSIEAAAAIKYLALRLYGVWHGSSDGEEDQ